jgi:hypothetical protein
MLKGVNEGTIPHWKLHFIRFKMSPEWTNGMTNPSRASAVDWYI